MDKTLPILRWVGGKRQLVRRLVQLLPSDRGNTIYCEPFLGAGSLYFSLRPARAYLSDANPHLMSCYEAIRRQPALVSRYIAALRKTHSKRQYYDIRRLYNGGGSPAVQAARFIYLNAACFNGVFRVNMRGEFNVPIGRKVRLRLPTPTALRSLSQLLRRATLRTASYDEVLGSLPADAFVYLDPPYPPLNGTSYFTHYTMNRFSHRDHAKLAEHARRLDLRGIRFLMTNADTPTIRSLYRAFDVVPLEVTRWVSGCGERYQVGELAIMNYSH